MFRRITKRFVIISNTVVGLFFLLGAFAHWFNPINYWPLALLGLSFPYFLLIILCFLVGWLLLKSKWSILNLALLTLAVPAITKVFALHPFSKKFDIVKKDSTTLRVLHWNTASFGEFDKNRIEGSDKRDKILNYIKESNADILCLQEFFDSFNPEFSQNINYITERLGYPYYYHAKDYERWATDTSGKSVKIGYWGNIIFSKKYLTDSGKTVFEKDYKGKNESLSYISIEHNKKQLTIFNTHLQSIRLRKSDYESIRDITSAESGTIEKSISITKKIIGGYEYRKGQADAVRNVLDSTKLPYIITGDFNDVPNSYTYAKIKGKNLQDAFLNKGFGIGRTYGRISPTLRIDYVLSTKDFEVIQYQKQMTNLSDHAPIIVDFKFK